MPLNSYNRGMPIIRRHNLVDPTVERPVEAETKPATTNTTPIDFTQFRKEQREQSRVQALKMRLHTFFWSLAS